MDARIAICLLVCAFYQINADVDIITEPRQGQEYVLVSSGQQTSLRNFETSHKIPEKHPHHRLLKDDGVERIIKKIHSGKPRHPTEGIISIEEDKKATFKKGQKLKSDSIEIDVPVSKLKDIKIKENAEDVETNPKMAVALEAMSESGKLTSSSGTTTQKPVLTTAPPAPAKGFDYIPINFDTIDDINSGLLSSNVQLETAGSEQKQHSRIQIKKGPNGQDYEYEYIYYYYDEEEGGKKEGKEKSSSTTAPSVHNSHDGPQKVESENQIPKDKNRNRYSTIDRTTTTAATPEVQNEVLPATTTSRGRQRGRNLTPAPVEEEIEEDRLPSSTRFPPRGRNLAAATTTTAVPEASSETARHRGRPQIDNVADESSGQTRSRTRAHIRRPSSELVDLDSFKTHSEDIPSQYKEQPSRYSSESKTTTVLPEVEESPVTKAEVNAKESAREGHSLPAGVIFQEILDDSKLPADYKQTTTYEQDTTEYTTMTAMEKVALDLYAYLAGENLNNEINPTSDMSYEGSTTEDGSWTTDSMSTTAEATTPTTTAEPTTTTTTTPVPTTTTTTAAPTRPSRFKGRPGARARISTTLTPAATEAPQQTSTKVRGRFGRPGVRKNTGTTAAVVDATPEPVAAERPVIPPPQAVGRRGLYAARTRPSSTTSTPPPEDTNAAPNVALAPSSRPRLRPSLRRSTTPTPAAPVAGDEPPNGSEESAETTPAPSRNLIIPRARPPLRSASLRPGPRLNLLPGARSRPGSATPETPIEASQAPQAPQETGEVSSTDDEAEASSATPASEVNPRKRLRNRLQVSPSPKPKVAATTPPRRVNPLLKRKQPSTEATTEAPKKALTETTEETTSAERSETETGDLLVDTTMAPSLRGIDALIARQRAAGIRIRPARIVRGNGAPAVRGSLNPK